jgi:hypothetical protein
MRTTTDHFVTQMKLAELKRQREKLRRDYHEVAQAASGQLSNAHRLERLCQGLQTIRFAGTSLHQDLEQLDVLLAAVQAGGVGGAVDQLWLETFQRALAAGQLRAEIVYAFGALLEEWAREGGASDDTARERSHAQRERLIAQLLVQPKETPHASLFDEVFQALNDDLERVAPKLKQGFAETKSAYRSVVNTLAYLQRDIYQSARLRDEAKLYETGDASRDFVDAIRLMMAEANSWDWPVEHVEVEAVWTRNKWRLYPRVDLPTACLLGEIADDWTAAFDRCFGESAQVANRRNRLKKLRELNAPEVILTNEVRMLRQAEERVSLQTLELVDPWQGFDQPQGEGDMESGSIQSERFERQQQARRADKADGYGQGYGGASASILLTHAEVQLARSAFPDLPLYVVKADLADYYNSIPHAVLLDLLERLRVPADERAWIKRYLKFPLKTAEKEHGRAARGVPMGFRLSDFLANLLMQFLERYICLEAPVRIVREMDDITLLSPTSDGAVLAWRRLGQFCEACGLTVNLEKCGAVCIGPGSLPQELPAKPPRWGMLELDEQGDWGVAQAVFDAHLAQAQDEVHEEQAILARVQKYNANFRFLKNALGATVHLGEVHRTAVQNAVAFYQLHFFAPDRSIVDGLVEEIHARFFAQDDVTIPESWIHWPVTAGGLGLHNPLLDLSQYRPVKKPSAPTEREPGWGQHNNAWAEFYRGCISEIPPVLPKETPQFKALVQDFIQRGKTISGGAQTDLSPYWRWVLAIYGPEILERLGSFRFLITELVPLQLISRQFLQDTSLQ